MTTLHNTQYFPTFAMLPLADEYVDPEYYQDCGGGTMLPKKHWCYFAEIHDDSLSHMPDFFHRVEVRDLTGSCNSILFSPDQDIMEYWRLKRGSTVFVRYATKAYFSDLMTQVIKVDDCNYVKVVSCPMDDLIMLSQWYFGEGSRCAACRRDLAAQTSSRGHSVQCCECEAAQYCSPECLQRHAPEHKSHCQLLQELQNVLNVDLDRFIQPVPFT
eukprot:GHRR01009025.1.p1 GENE.GHRR01009025.1~~GHRR01009025.1.p1  ORF type:complete len:215 (+),score=50.31 GHRR01009025.1:357-1001(+)